MADYTEEEKVEIEKWAKLIRRIPTARIGWAVRAKVQEHADKLHQKECQKQDRRGQDAHDVVENNH